MRTITQLSIEKAAQAWCAEETKHLVMDVKLCMEFAKILDGVWSKPWLGNATTKELISELAARLTDTQLKYKTVTKEGD